MSCSGCHHSICFHPSGKHRKRKRQSHEYISLMVCCAARCRCRWCGRTQSFWSYAAFRIGGGVCCGGFASIGVGVCCSRHQPTAGKYSARMNDSIYLSLIVLCVSYGGIDRWRWHRIQCYCIRYLLPNERHSRKRQRCGISESERRREKSRRKSDPLSSQRVMN